MGKLGHQVQRFDFTSGLAIIAVTPEGLEGGADPTPRRRGPWGLVASRHVPCKEPAMTNQQRNIAIRGAGVVGLWQALTLARRGHKVTVCERSPVPFAHACSLYAGAMLAPNCEKEAAELIVRDLGRRGLALARDLSWCCSQRHARRGAATRPRRPRPLRAHDGRPSAPVAGGARRAEPALVDRFAGALYYAEEGHLSPEPPCVSCSSRRKPPVLKSVSARASSRPMPISSSIAAVSPPRTTCRTLRGVRGERIVLRSREVNLSAPYGSCIRAFPSTSCPGATAST